MGVMQSFLRDSLLFEVSEHLRFGDCFFHHNRFMFISFAWRVNDWLIGLTFCFIQIYRSIQTTRGSIGY